MVGGLLIDSPMMALVRRETISLLRAKRSLAVLVASVAVLILWTALLARGRGPESAHRLFSGFVFVLYIVGGVVVPLFASLSVISERQRGTWDLLRMTALTPLKMGVAKALGPLLLFVAVLVALLPVMGVVFFMVGIDWTQFLGTVTVSTVVALESALLGVHSSVAARSTTMAVAGLVPRLFVLHLTTNPVVQNVAVIVPIALGFPLWSVLSWTAFHLIIVSALADLVRRRMRRDNSLAIVVEPPPDERRPWQPADPSEPGKADRVAPLPDNPAAGNALGCSVLLYLVFVCLMGSIILSSVRDVADMTDWWPIVIGLWLLFNLACCGMFMPMLIGFGLAREYERQTIDGLRMTLITARGYLRSRLLMSAGWTVALFVAFLFTVYGGGAPAIAGPWDLLLFLPVVLGCWADLILMLVLAQCMSLLGKRTATVISWALLGGCVLPLLFRFIWRIGWEVIVPDGLLVLTTGRGYPVDLGGEFIRIGVVLLLARLVFAVSVSIMTRKHMRDR